MSNKKERFSADEQIEIPEIQDVSSKYKIVAWVPIELLPKLQKGIIQNPELNAHASSILNHPDGDIEKICLRFRNCGRNQFHERLVSLFVKSLL